MNAKQFESITGRKPEQDDLERISCDKHGEAGHTFCGQCPECGIPRFMGCEHLQGLMRKEREEEDKRIAAMSVAEWLEWMDE